MIKQDDYDRFVAGLRETLLSQATAKSESEKRDTPETVAKRRKHSTALDEE